MLLFSIHIVYWWLNCINCFVMRHARHFANHFGFLFSHQVAKERATLTPCVMLRHIIIFFAGNHSMILCWVTWVLRMCSLILQSIDWDTLKFLWMLCVILFFMKSDQKCCWISTLLFVFDWCDNYDELSSFMQKNFMIGKNFVIIQNFHH